MAIFAEITENERIIDRHLRDIHLFSKSGSLNLMMTTECWSQCFSALETFATIALYKSTYTIPSEARKYVHMRSTNLAKNSPCRATGTTSNGLQVAMHSQLLGFLVIVTYSVLFRQSNIVYFRNSLTWPYVTSMVSVTSTNENTRGWSSSTKLEPIKQSGHMIAWSQSWAISLSMSMISPGAICCFQQATYRAWMFDNWVTLRISIRWLSTVSCLARLKMTSLVETLRISRGIPCIKDVIRFVYQNSWLRCVGRFTIISRVKTKALLIASWKFWR